MISFFTQTGQYFTFCTNLLGTISISSVLSRNTYNMIASALLITGRMPGNNDVSIKNLIALAPSPKHLSKFTKVLNPSSRILLFCFGFIMLLGQIYACINKTGSLNPLAVAMRLKYELISSSFSIGGILMIYDIAASPISYVC